MDLHKHLDRSQSTRTTSVINFCNEQSVFGYFIEFSIFSVFYVQSSFDDVKKICEISLTKYI